MKKFKKEECKEEKGREATEFGSSLQQGGLHQCTQQEDENDVAGIETQIFEPPSITLATIGRLPSLADSLNGCMILQKAEFYLLPPLKLSLRNRA